MESVRRRRTWGRARLIILEAARPKELVEILAPQSEIQQAFGCPRRALGPESGLRHHLVAETLVIPPWEARRRSWSWDQIEPRKL